MTNNSKKKFPRKKTASKKKTKTFVKKNTPVSTNVKKKGKKKFSQIKFKKEDNKPKDFFEEVMGRIKEGDYRSITKAVLKSLDKQDQVDQLVQILNKSKYRAYRLSFKNFNYTIHQYKKTKNKEILKAYLKNLETDKANISTEPNFRSLTDMQSALIVGLLNKDVDLFEEVVRIICEPFNFFIFPETDLKIRELYLEILIQLIDFKWPGKTKGLRVLYGKK